MGKGDKRRRRQVSEEVETANWEAVFGKRKLNIMSDEDKKERLTFLESLDRASKIVDKWPECKQNLLGGTRKDV